MVTYSYQQPIVSRLLSLPEIGQVLLTWGVEAGHHTDKEYYMACGIHKSTFSKIINGHLTLGDPSRPKILIKFVVALVVGRNGRRAIREEGDLLRFLTRLSRLPGQPVNRQGIEYVFDEVRRELKVKGIAWGVEDSEARLRARIRQVAPHVVNVIDFYDDLEDLNDGVTIDEQRILSILHEELRRLRGPES